MEPQNPTTDDSTQPQPDKIHKVVHEAEVVEGVHLQRFEFVPDPEQIAPPSEWEQAVKAAKLLHKYNHEAVIIGGAVRDLIMHQHPKDYDLATSAGEKDIERLFEKSKTPDTSQAYGVSRVTIDGVELEVATYRQDLEAHLGRQATQVNTEGVTLEQDLQRRDFTINAIALDPAYGIGYYIGESLNDLKNKLIRFVGEPRARIQEDPLRILRAVRFKNRFGFEYELKTHQALKDAVAEGVLDSIPGERLRGELTAMLRTAQSRRECLEDLDELGVLDSILPELTAGKGVEQGSKYHAEGDVWVHQLIIMEALPPDASEDLLWATLLHDIGKPLTQRATEDPNYFKFYGHPELGEKMAENILNRLKFTKKQKANIKWMIKWHINVGQLPNFGGQARNRMFNHPAFADLLELHRADGIASHSSVATEGEKGKKPNFDKIVTMWEAHQLLPPEAQNPSISRDLGVDGAVIKDLIPEFKKSDEPLIGRIKDRLEKLFADGKITTRGQAIEIAQQMIARRRK